MHFPTKSLTTAIVPIAVLLGSSTIARTSHAQHQSGSDRHLASRPPLASADAREPALRLVLGGAALVNTAGGGLEVDARLRWRSGVQLGLIVDGQAASYAYFGGTKAEGVAGGAARAVALFPLLTSRSVEFDIRVTTGLGYARDVSGRISPHREAVRSVSELSWLAHVAMSSRLLLRVGATLTFEMETKPTSALADQALLVTTGIGHRLSQNTLLYATIDAGGTYGFDGDNGKVVTRGALGLRWALAGAF